MATKTDQLFELTCPYTDNYYQGNASRYLFVCSAGILRSATAAKVAHSLGYNARAVGSEVYALIPISVNLIVWANKIFFVNEFNYLGTVDSFRFDPECTRMLKEKSVVWDIEDIYNYNDFTLVHKITELLK